jgi:hypothetical protein
LAKDWELVKLRKEGAREEAGEVDPARAREEGKEIGDIKKDGREGDKVVEDKPAHDSDAIGVDGELEEAAEKAEELAAVRIWSVLGEKVDDPGKRLGKKVATKLREMLRKVKGGDGRVMDGPHLNDALLRGSLAVDFVRCPN